MASEAQESARLVAPASRGPDGSIPVVDFGPFAHGSLKQKQTVAAELDRAFQKYGFLYLINHGIDEEMIKKCFQRSARFFALPEDIKQLAPHPPGGSHHRGYSAVSVEKVSQNVFSSDVIAEMRENPDIKESFDSGNEYDQDQPNIWPPDEYAEGFRTEQQEFFNVCTALIHQLLRALALVLPCISESYLSDRHSSSLFQLRMLHYPEVSRRALVTGQASRIDAHSDFGTLTLLWQDNVGGLEVQRLKTRKGNELQVPPSMANVEEVVSDSKSKSTFFPVPPLTGSVIVNVGDLLERWSNRRWSSAIHRVTAPPFETLHDTEVLGEQATNGSSLKDVCEQRYSIVFFATANSDTVIDTLPGCWGPDDPKLFEPVTAKEYIQMRMSALY